MSLLLVIALIWGVSLVVVLLSCWSLGEHLPPAPRPPGAEPFGRDKTIYRLPA